MFNNLQVYKILRIQINVMDKKEILFLTETTMFIFSYEYATMKPKFTLGLFSSFKGA